MGIPSYFRQLRRRYGKHLDTWLVSSLPDDTPCAQLYVDLNGIIHPCFHPERGRQPQSYDEVFAAILARLDELLAVAKPRRLLFLAVDGPAPRAKMNQQRGRRYRAAQEAEQTKSSGDGPNGRWPASSVRREGKSRGQELYNH